MRSGKWRGATLALGLACVFGLAASARSQDFHTIPRLVPAVDLNTGGPYYAPPIPYGHYAGKNLGTKIHGRVNGLLHGGGLGHGGLFGKGCNACGGKGCGLCGGGLGLGQGHGQGFDNGCGNCGGLHGLGDPCGGGLFKKGCGLGHGDGCGGHAPTVVASGQYIPTSQAVTVIPSGQCGDPGCGLFGGRSHKHRGGCGLCGGKGCGGCAVSDPCGSCGGKGCGLCGGSGGGKGLCNLCGGLGCGACAKAKGLVNHLLGRDKIKWFTGPGGPIPLTPGYTPYVITTRSPRDYFAFPPMTP